MRWAAVARKRTPLNLSRAYAPFGTVAQRLIDNGYYPLPIRPRSKVPAIGGWLDYRLSPDDLTRHHGAGVGLLCGKVVGVDIDVRDEALANEIERLAERMLGPAPRRIGRAPKVLRMYRADGEPFTKLVTPGYRLPDDDPEAKPHRVEVLATGQQFVAEGIHPETEKPYRWNGAGSPLTVPVAKLTAVTQQQLQSFLAAAEAVLGRSGRPAGKLAQMELADREHAPSPRQRADDSAALRKALKAIPNDDLEYDDWIRVCYAVKGGLGDEGLSEFLNWSAQSTKNCPEESERVFKAAKPRSLGAGTIFWLAGKNGVRPRSNRAEMTVMTLSSIDRQPLKPLWPGKLWLGKLALMAGDPGLGKSLVTLDIAARITTGREWPASSERAPIGDVMLLSAEDDPADTLRPRLEAAGANLDRIHVITEITEADARTGECRRKSVRIGPHLPQLEEVCRKYHPLLLVIDPITAYMSAETDSHATADVRSDLAPLAELAQRYGFAVLMVSHLNKATTMQALYRVTGSVAFIAAARSAFGVVRDPNDRDRRLFLPLKNNLGKDTCGLGYRIPDTEGTPRLEWEAEPVNIDIDSLMSAQEPRGRAKRAGITKVAQWLRDQLKDGSVAAIDIQDRARKAGHSERKLKAALRELGVEQRPDGFRGKWRYSLPPESGDSAGSENPPYSVRDSEHAGENAESDGARVPETARFRGNCQSRTDSDGFGEAGKTGLTRKARK
jgi:putative DNA primase/helicase